MAPFIPVPNVIQVNIRYSLDGEPIENVLNFEAPPDQFQASADTLYGILNEEFWPVLRSELSQDLVSTEVYMVDLTTASSGSATYPAFTDPTGNITAESEANSIALCVTHRTARRGRAYRGRSYVPGIATTNVNRNTVDQTVANGIANAFITLHNAAQAATLPFVIVSRYVNKLPRVQGEVTPVTQSLVRDRRVDSQRRRLPKGA